MKHRLCCLFAAFVAALVTSVASAQDGAWDELMQEIAEEQGDDDDGGDALPQLMEELVELHENPVNLNAVSREELMRFPFLSRKQAEAILDFRLRHGAFRSLGELNLIADLEPAQIKWLRQLMFVGEEPPKRKKSLPARPRHDLTSRIDIPAYTRQGWPWAQGLAHRARYTLQWGRHWDAGVRVEKDAGEEMFTRRNPLWDAWGGHVMLHDVNIGGATALQTAILGDYRVTFGEGIVMNTGFRFGKMQGNLWRQPASLRPHRSAEESHFLRGAAATFGCGPAWTLTALYSFRKLDATVQNDNTVRAINATGLHRTEGEMNRRRTLGSHTAALHAGWQRGGWRVGATAMFQYYDHQFAQGTALYRQIYPEGYLFGAASADYGLRLAHWAFSGETAYSRSRRGGGLATLNMLTWRPGNDLQLTAIQRFYSMDYFSPHAQAFGENAAVQNESGVCLMADASRLGPLALRVLFDYFYSPWPRYTMTTYSTGFQGTLHTTWQLGTRHTLVLRYALKSKERSDSRYFSHQLRASFARRFSPAWAASATAFMHHYVQPATALRSTGVAVMPRIDWQPGGGRLRSSLSVVWFSTGDYNSRLYLYEPSLMQTFGMQMLYGRGERVVATLRWQMQHAAKGLRRLQLQLKAGVTHYRDRDAISSGVTRIDGAWKADIQVFVGYRFR